MKKISKVHQSYSQIVLFLVVKGYLERVSSVKIHPIKISNLVPVESTVTLYHRDKWLWTWRLNKNILDDLDITETIHSTLKNYFAKNGSGKVI